MGAGDRAAMRKPGESCAALVHHDSKVLRDNDKHLRDWLGMSFGRPVRIQLLRKKGWRLPPITVKVDRTTKWGNPYRVGEPMDMAVARRWRWKIAMPHRVCESAEQAVKLFRLSLAFDVASKWVVRQELRGRNLACWCRPGEPCHADVLLEIANS